MGIKREFWLQYSYNVMRALRTSQPVREPDALGYPFISNDLIKTRAVLENVYATGVRTLLDVGAAIGNVVLLARQIGFAAHGIEIRPREHFTGILTPEAIEFAVDGMKFDHYDEYDAVYMSQSHPDNAVCERLVNHILSQLRMGGTLIYCGIMSEPQIRRTV